MPVSCGVALFLFSDAIWCKQTILPSPSTLPLLSESLALVIAFSFYLDSSLFSDDYSLYY